MRCKCERLSQLIGAPAGIRTPNQQIMRRFEGHQQGESKRDNPIFTESAAVKVDYMFLRQTTRSRHFPAIIAISLTLHCVGYGYYDWHYPQRFRSVNLGRTESEMKLSRNELIGVSIYACAIVSVLTTSVSASAQDRVPRLEPTECPFERGD